MDRHEQFRIAKKEICIDRVAKGSENMSRRHVEMAAAVQTEHGGIEKVDEGQLSLTMQKVVFGRSQIALTDVAADAHAGRVNSAAGVWFVRPKQVVDPGGEIVSREIALADARAFVAFPLIGLAIRFVR